MISNTRFPTGDSGSARQVQFAAKFLFTGTGGYGGTGDETTIADIQAAFKAKTLTCRLLVQMYLDRIDAYDKKGPALNAIVVINPDALKVADTLDTKFAQSGPVGPLHCVPLIVKDNYETTDMPTSAGSLSLKGVMSKTDAFQIKKLREAGALMLAKSQHGGVRVQTRWKP